MLTYKVRRVVKFFKTDTGKCPVEEFLDSLSAKQAQKITWVMRLLEDLDQVPSLYLKKLSNSDDIWELRAQVGSNIFRILGFFDSKIFIATNGFCKKSLKTPWAEITLATKRKSYYSLKRGMQYE